MKPIKTILVPTDFSPHSDEAFQVGRELARTMGAGLIVFHVAHPPAVISEDGRVVTHPGKGEAKDLVEEMRKAHPADAQLRVEHKVIIASRSSAAHILDILDTLGCDMIVMGTRGRTGLRHLLFGSVAEEVVRKAHCPVVVVKAPAHAVTEPTTQKQPQPATG
ncbi:MAG TPA: universal stress protein [Gemmataceae bacterium]|nr:universal stress protein [Gemmataceae bacterium]